jgi:hypothetical protein
MELDDVAAKALRVEGVELRRIFVGTAPEREHFRGTPLPPEGGQGRGLSAGAVRLDCVHKRRIGRKQVDVLVRRRLVENLVRIELQGGAHSALHRDRARYRGVIIAAPSFRCIAARGRQSGLARALRLGL